MAIRRLQPPLMLVSSEGRELSPPIQVGRYPQRRLLLRMQRVKIWPTCQAAGAARRLRDPRDNWPSLRHAKHRISPGRRQLDGPLLRALSAKRRRRTLHNRRHDL
jgi:hypothetical protein